MPEHHICMDDFYLESDGMPIFRIQYVGSATLLWTSREELLLYLQSLRGKKLQAGKPVMMRLHQKVQDI